MATVEWGGRTWETVTPGPTAALTFTRLTERDDPNGALEDVLSVMLSPDDLDRLVDGMVDRSLPSDLDRLVEALVVNASGRPLRAVVSLSLTCVRSWSVIRGHLVRSGVVHPLRDLPSLWSLLDLAESLILEGKDKKERDRYLHRMYPPTELPGSRNWSEAEEAASFAALAGGL